MEGHVVVLPHPPAVADPIGRVLLTEPERLPDLGAGHLVLGAEVQPAPSADPDEVDHRVRGLARLATGFRFGLDGASFSEETLGA